MTGHFAVLLKAFWYGIWVGYLWKKGKLKSGRRKQVNRAETKRRQLEEIGKGQSRVAKGRQGAVVMSIAKQSGVAGCRGRADALRIVVTMSTTLLVRARLYHGKRLVKLPSSPFCVCLTQATVTGKAPRQEIGTSGASTGAKTRIRRSLGGGVAKGSHTTPSSSMSPSCSLPATLADETDVCLCHPGQWERLTKGPVSCTQQRA